MKDKNNVMVVFEEIGGNPKKIDILVVDRDTICSVVTENHLPQVSNFERKDNKFKSVADAVKGAHLTCPDNKIVQKVEFVSFGDATGACGAFTPGKCDSYVAKKLVEQLCMGKTECTIPFKREDLDGPDNDYCKEIARTLSVQLKCGRAGKSDS